MSSGFGYFLGDWTYYSCCAKTWVDGKDDLGLRVCVNSWDIMPHDGTDELGLGPFGGNEEGTPRISGLSEQFRSHRQKKTQTEASTI